MVLPTPQRGQTQSSGKSSNDVPGSIPLFGSPSSGSYVYPHAVQMYLSILNLQSCPGAMFNSSFLTFNLRIFICIFGTYFYQLYIWGRSIYFPGLQRKFPVEFLFWVLLSLDYTHIHILCIYIYPSFYPLNVYIARKRFIPAPQWGQYQLLGRFSKGVPCSVLFLGSPASGSYI